MYINVIKLIMNEKPNYRKRLAYYLYFFPGLVIEPRASHELGKCPTTA
jgi:hypothetical protein